jgi:hypothetical protein
VHLLCPWLIKFLAASLRKRSLAPTVPPTLCSNSAQERGAEEEKCKCEQQASYSVELQSTLKSLAMGAPVDHANKGVRR